MIEFEQAGAHYRAGKMDVFRQAHVARRLLPLISALGSSAGGLGDMLATRSPAELLAAMAPVVEALATLPDADFEYILGSCLHVVQRQQGDVWAAAWSSSAKKPMFDDITLPIMLGLVMRVLTDNLGSFFPDLPASLTERIAAPPLPG